MAEERKRFFGWLSGELVLSMLLIVVGGVIAFESLASRVDVLNSKVQQTDRDNAQLKEQLNDQRKVIDQINLNVATLLERTKPGKP